MPDTPTTDPPPDCAPESSPGNAPEPAAEPESISGEPDPDSPAPPPPPSPLSEKLDVVFHLDTADTDPPAAGWLEVHLERAAHLCGVTRGSLSVTLIDDTEMTRLHGEYCGDPTTTDVLTFDLRGSEPTRTASESYLEGDLAVCRDQAVRQVASRGHDARTELLLYAVHGLMHLLGEDDHDPVAYQRMHQREDELLTALGFGPVFKSAGQGHCEQAGDAP